MAITYPLTLPLNPFEYSITRVQRAITTQTPYTGETTVQEGAAQYFEISLSFNPNDRDTMAAMTAALTALKGPVGTFLFGPLGNESTPRGIATGTPQVNGAGQSGNSTIITKGWTPSKTGIMKAGDWMSINNSLYIVLEDANSDGSGNATLSIWPKVRTNTNNNDSIVTTNPKGKFRMKNSSVEQIHTAGGIYRISDVEAVEAL